MVFTGGKGEGHFMTSVGRHRVGWNYSGDPFATRCYEQVGGQHQAPASLIPVKDSLPVV